MTEDGVYERASLLTETLVAAYEAAGVTTYTPLEWLLVNDRSLLETAAGVQGDDHVWSVVMSMLKTRAELAMIMNPLQFGLDAEHEPGDHPPA